MKNKFKLFLNVFLYPFKYVMELINTKKTDCTELQKQSENPYELIWYKQGWSDKKVEKNNTKYWEWEIKYNNFVPANTKNKTNDINKMVNKRN